MGGLACGSVISLVRQGTWVGGEHFQKTRAILASLQDMKPYEVIIMRIPSNYCGQLHRSDSNCVLAAQLGLNMDDGSRSILNVGGSLRHFHVGNTLFFDHTYKHSMSNTSSGDCIALACRFYHPRISEIERFALLFLALLMDAVQEVPLFRLASQF